MRAPVAVTNTFGRICSHTRSAAGVILIAAILNREQLALIRLRDLLEHLNDVLPCRAVARFGGGIELVFFRSSERGSPDRFFALESSVNRLSRSGCVSVVMRADRAVPFDVARAFQSAISESPNNSLPDASRKVAAGVPRRTPRYANHASRRVRQPGLQRKYCRESSALRFIHAGIDRIRHFHLCRDPFVAGHVAADQSGGAIGQSIRKSREQAGKAAAGAKSMCSRPPKRSVWPGIRGFLPDFASSRPARRRSSPSHPPKQACAPNV